jgi:hypothetical protein
VPDGGRSRRAAGIWIRAQGAGTAAMKRKQRAKI